MSVAIETVLYLSARADGEVPLHSWQHLVAVVVADARAAEHALDGGRVVVLVVDADHPEAEALSSYARERHPRTPCLRAGQVATAATGPSLPVVRVRELLHELTNPVASMQANLTWLVESLSSNEVPPTAELAGAARDSLIAAEQLGQRMRAFREAHTELTRRYELGRALSVGVELARDALALKGTVVRLIPPPGSTMLRGDPLNLSQLIVNLLLDAAPDATQISVGAGVTPGIWIELASTLRASALSLRERAGTAPPVIAGLLALLGARLQTSATGSTHIVRLDLPF